VKPYIFCEPFAGSAALTYYLLGGKPPISYMGGKSGYAAVICQVLGLSQRNKPAGIVLCEPGPFAAVHATLGGASGSAEDVASLLLSTRWSFSEKGPEHGYGGPGCEVRTTKATWTTEARDACLSADNFSDRMDVLPLPASKAIANIIRSWKDEEPRALWNRLKAKGWPSLLLPEGCRGRWLGPQSLEDAASWLTFRARSHNAGSGEGYCPPHAPAPLCEIKSGKNGWDANGNPVHHYYGLDHPADQVESLPTFPALAVYQGFAEDLALPKRLDGCVIFADPPYENTTKYKHGDCNRETVLRLARDWSARGAIVAISEAVRLDRELGDGWHAVQIDHARRGQKRTFSKQQDEWVTLNRPPQYVPPKQQGLFG